MALFLNQFFLSRTKSEFFESAGWSAGGPAGNFDEAGFIEGYSSYALENNSADIDAEIPVLDAGTLLAPGLPLTNVTPLRHGVLKYKVQAGDTLSSIAANFGIDIETIRLANPGARSLLKVGQELTILSVSGILYETKDGDTPEFVANLYGVPLDLIKQFNPDYQKLFASPGNLIILPNAKPINRADYLNRYVRGLPDLGNYFALPARGWNWGQLHDYNAVDIADECGRPIYASAEGLVIEERSGGFWNRGYGNYILIEHPNGTRTRYAHTAKNLVRTGDYVAQGDVIAFIGNTGNTHGPTGCHLHFEVYGAKNPFAIK
jgi:murein DD-endopeptidase MepM/ murein hydrolase activator NlpD